MQRIIAGTDLTDHTRSAVAYAADLAEPLGATLHLVTGCTVPVVVPDTVVAGIPTAGEITSAAETEIESLAADYRRRGLTVETSVCVGGAADVLCRVAEKYDADLIVVGNRRMQGPARILGSVANRVAHHAPCSVLVAKTC